MTTNMATGFLAREIKELKEKLNCTMNEVVELEKELLEKHRLVAFQQKVLEDLKAAHILVVENDTRLA